MSPSLTLLKQLQSTASIHLESIGFQWCDWPPCPPAPMDILPFATTGGDGCYFAFLTDFGYWKKLEEAPVVFICPSDFDEQNPHFANKIVARNIRDFLRILISIPSAEMLRFKKLEEIDFESELKKRWADIESNTSALFVERRQRTVEIIKSAFDITEVENLSEYYTLLLKERATRDFLPLKDGLGLKTQLDTNVIIRTDFSDLATLDEKLFRATELQRLMF